MKISIIGAGRVGSAVAERLFERKMTIAQVFSRDEKRAHFVAENVRADAVSSFEKISPDVDVFLITVPDAAIFSTAKLLSKIQPRAVAVHFSGATDRAVLAAFFEKNGVIWPIQSFSVEKKVNWRQIPMAVESSEEAKKVVQKLAQKLGPRSFEIDAAGRARLHLAATMANNFSNHLFALVREFMAENVLPPEAILPLVGETFEKIKMGADPRLFQTGPAQRGDAATIERHLELLQNEPELAELYRFFTASIQKR